MTEPAPMVPNAEERLRNGLNRAAWTMPKAAVVPIITAMLEAAHRDGFAAGVRDERARREAELVELFGAAAEDQPSATALEFAHDQRWPNDRIDIARFCDAFAEAERARIIVALREPGILWEIARRAYGELECDPVVDCATCDQNSAGSCLHQAEHSCRALADHLEQTNLVGIEEKPLNAVVAELRAIPADWGKDPWGELMVERDNPATPADRGGS